MEKTWYLQAARIISLNSQCIKQRLCSLIAKVTAIYFQCAGFKFH